MPKLKIQKTSKQKPKRLESPSVAGCCMAHKPLPQHLSRWDMGQNKKWKCTFGTFLHHRVSVISGGSLLIFKHSLFSSLCFTSVIGGYERAGDIATDSWALLGSELDHWSLLHRLWHHITSPVPGTTSYFWDILPSSWIVEDKNVAVIFNQNKVVFEMFIHRSCQGFRFHVNYNEKIKS